MKILVIAPSGATTTYPNIRAIAEGGPNLILIPQDTEARVIQLDHKSCVKFEGDREEEEYRQYPSRSTRKRVEAQTVEGLKDGPTYPSRYL